MVGAALFLPHNAFAEKNGLNVQQNPQTSSLHANQSGNTDDASVQPNVPVKAENAKKTEVAPEPAVKNQGVGRQQESNHNPQQTLVPKQAATPKSLPNQAKGNGQPSINKGQKNVEAPGQQKSETIHENNRGLGNDKQTVAISHKPFDAEMRDKAESLKRVTPQREGSHLSTQKAAPYKPLVPEPSSKGQAPVGKEDVPNADRPMSPTQRSNNSGGSSNDRVSQGLSSMSMLDKWFEWNKHYEIKFVQLYLSRYALLSNQWVNAPPAPPPQKAPLLKLVTRS